MPSGDVVLGWSDSRLPEIILGLVCFTIMVASAVVLLTRRWCWVCVQLRLTGAAALFTYLQWYRSFELMALCLWCMIIWTATIPFVSLVTIGNLARGRLGKGAIGVGRTLIGWAWVVIVIWFVAVIGLVLAGMWELIALSLI